LKKKEGKYGVYGYKIKVKVDFDPYQPAEQFENNCHIPDFAHVFPEENGGLNLVLPCTKPPICITVMSYKDLIKLGKNLLISIVMRSYRIVIN
jgi:hypothetical protein